MSKGRLEAFTDGVIAILITIMVLELKIPHGTNVEALRPLVNIFLTYVLSFTFLGIYWNNHHHMFHACDRIAGKVLWANLHLLFWLSLVPFVTGWMGENCFTPIPTAVYGGVLFMAGVAYYILQWTLISVQGDDSKLKEAIGSDFKGKFSPVLYLTAIGFAFVQQWISLAIYALVELMWLIPDRRIESRLAD